MKERAGSLKFISGVTISSLLLVCIRGAGTTAALVLSSGGVQAGLEEEIAKLRKEVAEMKKDVGEIKNLLQEALKPQTPPKVTAAVGISSAWLSHLGYSFRGVLSPCNAARLLVRHGGRRSSVS